MGSVYQLYYVSTATDPMSDEQLAEMLEWARLRNSCIGVTGMLLYVGRNFCQALEGPRTEVRAIFEKIAKDPRHRDIHIVLETDGEVRDFPDWLMGFRRSDPAILGIDSAIDLTGVAPSRFERVLGDGGALKSLLKSFYRTNH